MADVFFLVFEGIVALIGLVVEVGAATERESQRRRVEEQLSPGFEARVKALKSRREQRRPKCQPHGSKCSLCSRDYSWMSSLWQRHCCQCGRSVCNDCSAKSKAIPEFGYMDPVRVCLYCIDEPLRLSLEERQCDEEDVAEIKRVLDHEHVPYSRAV